MSTTSPIHEGAYCSEYNSVSKSLNILLQFHLQQFFHKFINIFQWRRFNFFDKEAVKDPSTDQVFDQLKVSNLITALI